MPGHRQQQPALRHGPPHHRDIAHHHGRAGGTQRHRAGDGLGADAFITGEVSEPQAHLARETGVAFLACGHHATERYGAPALGEHLARQFGVHHQFIEIENPA